MEIKFGFHYKCCLVLVSLCVIVSTNVAGSKSTVVHVDLSVGYGFDRVENRNATVEKGNSLEIRWKTGHGTNGYLLHEAETYVTEAMQPTSVFRKGYNAAEMIQRHKWEYLFGNRLKVSYNNALYKTTVENVTYTDSGQYSIEGKLDNGTSEIRFHSSVKVQVNGGPEFCEDKVTSESSKIHFTLCGFPTPKVLWSYDTKQQYSKLTANASKDKAYIKYFSLTIKKNKCVHFVAIGHKDKILSWKEKADPVSKNQVACDKEKEEKVKAERICEKEREEKGYQDKHKRPSFLESVEGKAVIAGCGIICLALISLVTLLVFCHIRKGKKRCATSREESQDLVSGNCKFKAQDETDFDKEITTKLDKVDYPYYSEIKDGSANKTFKSKQKIPTTDINSNIDFAEKLWLSENNATYAKLGLIDHSPYVDLGPTHPPKANFTVSTDIKKDFQVESLHQEFSANVRVDSENKSSSRHSDSSYTEMESYYTTPYSQLQKIKPDAVRQNNSLDSMQFETV